VFGSLVSWLNLSVVSGPSSSGLAVFAGIFQVSVMSSTKEVSHPRCRHEYAARKPGRNEF
jgi:hypothetical protein